MSTSFEGLGRRTYVCDTGSVVSHRSKIQNMRIDSHREVVAVSTALKTNILQLSSTLRQMWMYTIVIRSVALPLTPTGALCRKTTYRVFDPVIIRWKAGVVDISFCRQRLSKRGQRRRSLPPTEEGQAIESDREDKTDQENTEGRCELGGRSDGSFGITHGVSRRVVGRGEGKEWRGREGSLERLRMREREFLISECDGTGHLRRVVILARLARFGVTSVAKRIVRFGQME